MSAQRAGRAARAHHADRRIAARPARLRPDHRGGVREPRAEGAVTQEAEPMLAPRRLLREQHVDAADQRAGAGERARREKFVGIHFFSPVRQDEAGRDHPRPGRPTTRPSPARSTTCSASARCRSSSTTRAASSRAACSARAARRRRGRRRRLRRDPLLPWRRSVGAGADRVPRRSSSGAASATAAPGRTASRRSRR